MEVFGPESPQPNGTKGRVSEDCLYLNVWSPAESASDGLPVMVWLHGGTFSTGSGSSEAYDGETLARQGVVVVTINYRLGPFGFLAHPALSEENSRGVSGNYGLLDQIAALQWVQKNITAFGGDPNRVTLFGHSAGAISILDLMVSPLAKGLFQRAIVQSAMMLDWGGKLNTAASLESKEAEGVELAQDLGVGQDGDVAAQLRSKTADEILEASRGLEDGLLPWRPVVDGYVLPDFPTALWEQGSAVPIPLLIGSTHDETKGLELALPEDDEDYRMGVESIFGSRAAEVLDRYPPGTEPAEAFSLLFTRLGFAGTARFAAETIATSGGSRNEAAAGAYLYEFTRPSADPSLGSPHGLELGYVWGTMSYFSSGLGPITEQDQALSQTIMGYWTRFAATGDPNGGGAVEWPRYDSARGDYLELGTTVAAKAHLYEEDLDFADSIRTRK